MYGSDPSLNNDPLDVHFSVGSDCRRLFPVRLVVDARVVGDMDVEMDGAFPRCGT